MVLTTKTRPIKESLFGRNVSSWCASHDERLRDTQLDTVGIELRTPAKGLDKIVSSN